MTLRRGKYHPCISADRGERVIGLKKSKKVEPFHYVVTFCPGVAIVLGTSSSWSPWAPGTSCIVRLKRGREVQIIECKLLEPLKNQTK